MFNSRPSYSKYIVKKCQSRLNFMRLLSGVTWGADTHVLLVIYRVLIRPVIEYGFEVYLSSHQYVLKRMQTIQNSALRVCCGAMKSSPICALQHFCNEHSITIRRLQASLMYRRHVLSIPNHPCRALLDHTWHEFFPDSSPFCTFNMLTSSVLPCDSKIATIYFLPNPHERITVF